MSNSFGKKFKITVFGESHGKCVGVVVEGCPPGQKINIRLIQDELNRRKSGQNVLTTQRKEDDKIELLTGVLNEHATGAPITMLVRNHDVDSTCYENIKCTPRPGHADFTARIKYNGYNDYRGGGMFSGRMTAAFVMAGSVAKQILNQKQIKVKAKLIQIGNSKTDEEMKQEILKAKDESDSVGGLIECRVLGMPVGIGEPIFDSVESALSRAIFSIPGVKGIEFGSGFRCVNMKGSEHNDPFILKDRKVVTTTNNSGGILGGLSNGMPIILRVAIKPTSSIFKEQKTVNLETMNECSLKIEGRHDPCIAIRAVPVIESMIAITLVDLLLR